MIGNFYLIKHILTTRTPSNHIAKYCGNEFCTGIPIRFPSENIEIYLSKLHCSQTV